MTVRVDLCGTLLLVVATLSSCRDQPAPPAPTTAATGASSSSAAATDPGLLRETLASLAKNPDARIAKRKDHRGKDVQYSYALDGVRDAMLVVVVARPDAWSWSLFAPGLAPTSLGPLADLPPTPGGGQRWVVTEGALAGAQIYRASNQDGLLVVESATWRDAHVE